MRPGRIFQGQNLTLRFSPRACRLLDPKSLFSPPGLLPCVLHPRAYSRFRLAFLRLLLLLRPFPQGFCPEVFAVGRIFPLASHFSAHSFPYNLSPRASALRTFTFGRIIDSATYLGPLFHLRRFPQGFHSRAYSISPLTEPHPVSSPPGLCLQGAFSLASYQALPRGFSPGATSLRIVLS